MQEEVKQYTTELEGHCYKIRTSKFIKNNIKKELVESLEFISRFLLVGPGVTSPVVVKQKINRTGQLTKAWIRDVDLAKGILETIGMVKIKFLEPSETDDEATEIVKAEKVAQEVAEIRDIPKKDRDMEAELKDYVNKVPKYVERLRPEKLEKLDISYLPIGPVPHYCMVYKILSDVTYVIPITSHGDMFQGCPIEKSRFLKGKFIYTLYQFPTSLVLSRFVMPYDARTEGTRVCKEISEYFKSSVIPKTRKQKKSKK